MIDSKKPLKHGRRSFLIGAGGATLAIPFLPSLMSDGKAQLPATKNFVSYRITNGYFGHQWYPSDSVTGGPTGLMVMEPNVREMSLSSIAGPISPLLDDAMSAFRSKMVLMRHIDRLDRSDHNAPNGLFGWSNKDAMDGEFVGLPPSIDQLIATHVFGGSVVPLNLAVRWSETGSSCSFSVTPAGELVMETGLYPHQAYQRLFADFMVDESTATRRRGYEATVVDRVLGHYRDVRNHPRLGTRDRDVLDQHIEHMQTLHQQLTRATAECAPPASPERWEMRPEQVDAAAQAQVDIAVAALRCGLTHVVNFYLDPDTLFTPPLHGVGDGGYHAQSHNSDPGAVTSCENAQRWHMRYLADFLAKLDETIDPVGGMTLLDNSLVFVNNEIGNQNGASGNRSDDLDLNHIGLDVQTLLVGSCGGAIRTGMYLDYRTDFTRNRWTRYIGTAYNRLLVSIMLAMGMTPDQWEVGGSPGYGDMRGALYDMTPLDKVVVGDMRAGLPRLMAT
jgi:hypothetical protein